MLEYEKMIKNFHPTTRRQTHYTVLGIPTNATQSQIREAFFRMRNLYTVSNQALYSLVDQTGVDETLKNIELAFKILSIESKRRAYDLEIGLESIVEEPILKHQNTIQPVNENSRILAHREHISIDTATPIPQAQLEGASRTHSPIEQKGRILRSALRSKDPSYLELVKEELHDLENANGQIFKRLRENLGVTLDEIHHNTKVSLQVISNIESDSFALLPQMSYFKGFLQSYLNYLGIPQSKEVAAVYVRKIETWTNKQSI